MTTSGANAPLHFTIQPVRFCYSVVKPHQFTNRPGRFKFRERGFLPDYWSPDEPVDSTVVVTGVVNDLHFSRNLVIGSIPGNKPASTLWLPVKTPN